MEGGSRLTVRAGDAGLPLQIMLVKKCCVSYVAMLEVCEENSSLLSVNYKTLYLAREILKLDLNGQNLYSCFCHTVSCVSKVDARLCLKCLPSSSGAPVRGMERTYAEGSVQPFSHVSPKDWIH